VAQTAPATSTYYACQSSNCWKIHKHVIINCTKSRLIIHILVDDVISKLYFNFPTHGVPEAGMSPSVHAMCSAY
jgi:hypothetical protein